MKKYILLFILILICSFAYGSQLINVHKLTKAPVIDGVLDDECYKNCAVINNFLNLSDSKLGYNKDKVYVAYDDENLYLGMEFYSDNLKADLIDRKNAPVWSDDDMEFFIMGKDTYYMVALNGENSGYMGKEKSSVWYNEITYKTIKSDFGWTGEMIIPFSVLELDHPKEVGFNITGAKQKEDKLFTWSDLFGGTFHNPKRFGKLIFNEDLPIINIDNISVENNIVSVKGNCDSSVDYTISINDIKKTNKTSNEININEAFDTTRGMINVSFSKDGNKFYETGFTTGIYSMDCDLQKDILNIKLDFSSPLLDKYSKIALYVKEKKFENIRDAKVYFGENITFVKPFIKELKYKLPKKGKYDVILEIWSLKGLESNIEKEIEVK